jgi:hypothetical protein
VWSTMERINILFIIASGANFSVILIIIVIISIHILFNTFMELLDLPSHFIPLEFLHTTPTNRHGRKSKALIPTWYREGMEITKL